MEPINLFPTWNNNWSGEACVVKRLDRFSVHHEFLQYIDIYSSWVGKVICLDHFPFFWNLKKVRGNQMPHSNLIHHGQMMRVFFSWYGIIGIIFKKEIRLFQVFNLL
jgi:hypothetical protein